MKKISTISFLILCTIFVCTSCTKMKKNNKIKQYDKFVTEVTEKHKTYTDADWKKADEEYGKYCVFFEEEKIRNILTPDEKKEVAKLKGKYQGLRLKTKAKEKMKDAVDWLKEKGKYVEGVVEGATE